jgi:flagellar hook-associated protein 3 FlgL
MRRVSSDMSNNDAQYWLRRTESRMQSTEKSIASESRIGNLRDDPVAAAHAVRYASFASRLERFESNALRLGDAIKSGEGYVRQSIDVMQRVRELAVQGSQNTLSKTDMGHIAAEVDELLKELVMSANAKDADGTALFAGTRSLSEPFRAVMGRAPGSAAETIIGVEYTGAIASNKVEIGEGEYIESDLAGNAVFWSDRQHVVSSRDARGFVLLADETIRVDGREVLLKAGDDVLSVAAKINGSGAAVKASMDPETAGIAIETTDAHQLWLEDGPGGDALVRLGILKGSGAPPPADYAESALVSGGSLFDSVIALRDALNKGDVFEIGGRGIAGIDSALHSLERRVAEIGSRSERLSFASGRLNREIPDVTAQLSREQDIDLAEAITDLRSLENTQKASLQVAGRLFPQTLLDFLR